MIDHKTHKTFPKLDYAEFMRRYKKEICIIVNLEKLKKEKVGTVVANHKTYIYHPQGDCEGKPKRYNVAKQKDPKVITLIRIPCLKIYKSFLAMDGNHRLEGLKPVIVIIDFIEITKKSNMKYCQDLSNVYWQTYIERKGLGYVY